MDEVATIPSTEVLITSKFFMLMKDLAAGESVDLSKSYHSDTSSVQEIADLVLSWDVNVKTSVVSRFVYGPNEINDNFGKVTLQFTKIDFSDVALDDSDSGTVVTTSRSFSYTIKITAIDAITRGSLLRI